MSTPSAPRSSNPAAPSSTRQMLDELDALMQRMLALPVNQLDEEAAAEDRGVKIAEREAAPPPVRSEAPAPPIEAPPPPPTLNLPPVTFAPRPAPPEPRPAPKLIAHPPAHFPPVPHWAEAPVPDPFTEPDEPEVPLPPANGPAAAPPGPAPLPAPPVRLPPRPYPAPPRTPAPPTRRLEWALRSLLWSNRTFDRCTGWLGSAGRMLRGPRGRQVLGWVGLGLWALALILLVLRFLR